MNKDMIGEICKYLDRDIYMLDYYDRDRERGSLIYHHYSYEGACKQRDKLIIDNIKLEMDCYGTESWFLDFLGKKIKDSNLQKIKKWISSKLSISDIDNKKLDIDSGYNPFPASWYIGFLEEPIKYYDVIELKDWKSLLGDIDNNSAYIKVSEKTIEKIIEMSECIESYISDYDDLNITIDKIKIEP